VTLSTSPDVLAAHLAGEAVLLNLLDKSYYRLNETAAAVWAGFEKGESRDQILDSLLQRYSVEKAVAEKELDSVIDEMKSRKLLVENSGP
jgi:hypothetical protein